MGGVNLVGKGGGGDQEGGYYVARPVRLKLENKTTKTNKKN